MLFLALLVFAIYVVSGSIILWDGLADFLKGPNWFFMHILYLGAGAAGGTLLWLSLSDGARALKITGALSTLFGAGAGAAMILTSWAGAESTSAGRTHSFEAAKTSGVLMNLRGEPEDLGIFFLVSIIAGIWLIYYSEMES